MPVTSWERCKCVKTGHLSSPPTVGKRSTSEKQPLTSASLSRRYLLHITTSPRRVSKGDLCEYNERNSAVDRPYGHSFHADTQKSVPEAECLPRKQLVQNWKNIITWFLAKCIITGAFAKYTSRRNMALGLRANNTDSWTLRMGPIGCPETSVVRNYHYALRNDPEERSSQYGHATCVLFFSTTSVRNIAHRQVYGQ